MYQLLLDSSNKYLSVGLAKDGVLVDQIFYEAWQRQSEVMVSEVENIMKRNSISKDDLDAVAVGKGPGSYTGVRIAITIGKTIAFALGIKLYAKSSLFLLKDSKKPTICIFNARSGRCYFAVYDENGNTLVDDSVITNEEAIKYINEHPSYSLAGDVEQLGYKSINLNILENLSSVLFKEENLTDPFKLGPIYLKDLMK